MAFVRWDPFQDPFFRGAFDSFLDRPWLRPIGASGLSWRSSSLPMDVYTEGDGYVIEVALPGLQPEAVNVSVLGNQVTIRGEHPTPAEGRQYLLRERSGGRFERTLTLPHDVDADKAEAHYQDGVLRLVVPIAESARPRRIALTAGQ